MTIQVRYTARRSLVSGTSNGQTVTLALDSLIAYAGLNRTRESSKYQRISLGFVTEAYYYGKRILHQVQLIPLLLTGDNAKAIRMFLDSTEDGQVFEFDTGDGASWRKVRLESSSYPESRNPSNDSKAAYSFELGEVVA